MASVKRIQREKGEADANGKYSWPRLSIYDTAGNLIAKPCGYPSACLLNAPCGYDNGYLYFGKQRCQAADLTATTFSPGPISSPIFIATPNKHLDSKLGGTT